VPDELEVDRVDRAIVPVANRNSSEDSNWRRHEAEKLDRIYGINRLEFRVERFSHPFLSCKSC